MTRLCWVEDFSNHLTRIVHIFPTLGHQLEALLQEFAEIELIDYQNPKEFLWGEGGQRKASYFRSAGAVDKEAPTDEALEYMGKWDADLDAYGLDEETSRFVRAPWHISELWVNTEARRALLRPRPSRRCR